MHLVTGRGLIFPALALIFGMGFQAGADAKVTREGDPSTEGLTVAKVFPELPVTVLDLLPRSTRLDMIAYAQADSLWEAPNALEGLSRIDTISGDYMKVTVTQSSSIAIRILPLRKGEELVMTLYTVGGKGNGADTDIRFFSPAMKELPRDRYFKLPDLKEFFDIPKGSLTSMKEIRGMLPFYTVEYDASAPDGSIVAKMTSGDYINTDDYNILKLFLRPSIIYCWDGKSYRLRKE